MTQYDTNRSSAEIEREIEAERSALTESLEAIQNQFSTEHIVEVVGDRLRTNGGDVARSFGNAVKENPMALALTGIGLAWLMAGSRKSQDDETLVTGRRGYGARSDSRLDRPYGRTGRAYPMASSSGRRDPAQSPYGDVEDDDYVAWGRTRARAGDFRRNAKSKGRDMKASAKEAGHDAKATAQDARAHMSQKASDLTEDLSDSYEDSRDQMRARAGEMGRSARGLRDRGYRRASELRDRISEGTENMSAEARERVMAAREAAVRAQHRVEREFERRSAQARDFMRDEPLIAGAVSLAIGAAIGAALPRTRVEDEAVGEYRDRVFDEAERVFEEESRKLKAVGEAALNETREMANDAVSGAKSKVPHGNEAVEKAEKGATDAANRVTKAARDEAEKQNLGGSLSSSKN